MLDTQWATASEILAEALSHDPTDRRVFIEEACGSDQDLRQLVERLSSLDDARGDFLKSPFAAQAIAFPDLSVEKADDFVVGQSVGAYTIVRTIGRGGMGTVYGAERHDDLFQGEVAIKVVHSPLVGSEELDRFRREIQILADFDHPHIVKLLDAGIIEGRTYLVMEAIEGLPIDIYCEEHKLGREERLLLFRKVCAAVHFSHQNLVVHRDLKPSNILVDNGGEPKLLDFGVAKLLDAEDTESTRNGWQPLTPAYASPEQFFGSTVTTASDVYSLGVLLYLLLAGSLPRDPTGIGFAQLERCFEKNPRSLCVASGSSTSSQPRFPHIRSAFEAELDSIIHKALARDPTHRYASVAQFSEDLKRHLVGLPVTARGESLTYRVRKLCHRHRLATALVASLFFSLAISTVVISGLAFHLARQTEVAEMERDRAANLADLTAELFTAPDPWRGAGSSTLREVLDRAASRITRELEDDPVIQASLFDVIGRTYINIEEYEIARQFLEPALRIRQEVYPSDHLQMARSLENIGILLTGEGQPLKAIEALNRGREIRIRSLGKDHPETIEILTNLALAHLSNGNNIAAETLVRETLQVADESTRFRGLLGKYQGRLYRYLSIALRMRGDFAAGEEAIRKALDLTTASVGEEHPEYTLQLRILATLLSHQGKDEEAVEAYEKAIERVTATLGPDSLRIGLTLDSLANHYLSRGDFVSAEPLLLRGIEYFRRRPSSKHLALGHNSLGRLYEETERFSLAASHYSQALTSFRVNLADDHQHSLAALTNLAGATVKLGRHREAIKLYLEAQDLLGRRLAVDQDNARLRLYLAHVYNGLGKANLGLGNQGKAHENWRRILDTIAPVVHSTSAPIYRAIYITALFQIGHLEEARPAAEKLLKEGWHDRDFLEICHANGLTLDEIDLGM